MGQIRFQAIKYLAPLILQGKYINAHLYFWFMDFNLRNNNKKNYGLFRIMHGFNNVIPYTNQSLLVLIYSLYWLVAEVTNDSGSPFWLRGFNSSAS